MSMKMIWVIGLISVAMAVGLTHAQAAKPVPPVIPLSAEGELLHTRYSEQLKALQAEVAKRLPKIDEQKRSALHEAIEAVKGAEAKAEAVQKSLSKIQTAKALVDHAKGKWIGGAEQGIAKAKQMLQAASTGAEREAAQQELAR